MLHFNKSQMKVLGAIGVVIIGLLSFLIIKDDNLYGKESEIVEITEDNEISLEDHNKQDEQENKESETIKVYIVGQVKQPGVLEVPRDCRLNEVVEMAGGFLSDADLLRVNLAIKVQDEGMYLIPKIGEDTPKTDDSFQDSFIMGSQSGSDQININTADQSQLETLPRIGPAIAKNIIEYREQNGPFKNIEDIMNVPRIGEKTFEGLKDYITVN